MSNDINIKVPEGFVAVHNADGTIDIVPAPVAAPGQEALQVNVHMPAHIGWYAEDWQGDKYGWSPPTEKTWGANSKPVESPTRRNVQAGARITITVLHPDEKWVREAISLIEDYAQNYLADSTEGLVT